MYIFEYLVYHLRPYGGLLLRNVSTSAAAAGNALPAGPDSLSNLPRKSSFGVADGGGGGGAVSVLSRRNVSLLQPASNQSNTPGLVKGVRRTRADRTPSGLRG